MSMTETTGRIIAEQRRDAAEAQTARDLAAITRLQQLGTLFLREGTLNSVLGEIVDAAISIADSDFGNIQLIDPDTGNLRIASQRGFPQWWVDFWNDDARGQEASGTAFELGTRVIVENVEHSTIFAGRPALDMQLRAGVRAVQSTPLIDRSGERLGILSTHYRTPQRPDGRALALLDLLAQQAAEIIARARAEAALRESEAKFRTVFNSIDEGFLILEMIRDETGRPVDLRILEANPALTRLTGLGSNSVGKLGSEFLPNLERFWLETYDRVARTGAPERVENYNEATDKWYKVHVSKVGGQDRQVALVFDDVTERKRVEIALRESEERQVFLLKFSDALRAEQDASTVADRAVNLLADKLGLDLCCTASFHVAQDRADVTHQARRGPAPELPPTLRLSDFPDAFRQTLDRTLIFNDIVHAPELPEFDRRNMAALGLGAMITVPLRRGPMNVIWSLTAMSLQPRTWTTSEIALVQEASERTWAAMERARAEAYIKESEARFQQFAAASSGTLWIRDAATRAMEYVSPAIARIYGVEPEAILGDLERWAATIVPDDRDIALEHVEKARQGEAVTHEFRIQRPSDQAFRWIRDTAFPLRDERGIVQRIGGIAEDITEAKLAVQHQGVLLAELQHRVHNIIAVISVISARSGERANGVAEFSHHLKGRLLALARVQALLTRAANISVDIASLVHDEISAQAQQESQFDIDGPNVTLSTKAAEVLMLAVHELSTNALKYGALSVPDGKVTVRWTTFEKCGAKWLSFEWTEEGAPPRQQPTTDNPRRRGFGSELIEGRIPYELDGHGRLTIEPGGARCHLEFPLKNGASVLETGAPQRATVFGGALDMTGEPDLSGHRVLVVEDDYYLATDAARALLGAGAEVLGPCSSDEAARRALAEQRPDAVLLDINLGSGPSFKLAETLEDRGIPFVFITGYDQSVIPAEFDAVERLEKPVQLRQIVGALSKLLTRAT